ncbi:MAG: hypothetical protein ABIM96_03880 [Candidatus Saccharimonas sp.]
MNTPSLDGLVKQASRAHIPSKSSLNARRTIGFVLVLGAVIMVFTGLFATLWWIPVALFVAGLVDLISQSTSRHEYYKAVTQGRVLKHEFYSSLSGDSYYLVMLGYNIAGEVVKYEAPVEPKLYYETNNGDLVDLSNKY